MYVQMQEAVIIPCANDSRDGKALVKQMSLDSVCEAYAFDAAMIERSAFDDELAPLGDQPRFGTVS